MRKGVLTELVRIFDEHFFEILDRNSVWYGFNIAHENFAFAVDDNNFYAHFKEK
jgi:hypothetical protein